LTIEDPIEFMHRHKRSIFHQRQLHSDTPSFARALRAALRQPSKVILDDSLHGFRSINAFPMGEQQIIRNRLGRNFRAIFPTSGAAERRTLLDATADGDTDGMQHFRWPNRKTSPRRRRGHEYRRCPGHESRELATRDG
jgi:hypothetical protein